MPRDTYYKSRDARPDLGGGNVVQGRGRPGRGGHLLAHLVTLPHRAEVVLVTLTNHRSVSLSSEQSEVTLQPDQTKESQAPSLGLK